MVADLSALREAAGDSLIDWTPGARVGGALHVVAQGDRRPWHLVREAGGNWGEWRAITSAAASAPTQFDTIACADVGRSLQIVVIAGGVPWFTQGKADGTWQAPFGNVRNQLTGEPSLTALDVA